MKGKHNKRPALRIADNDPEGEAQLPVMKTKDLAVQHVNSLPVGKYVRRKSLNEIGTNEDGKEAFEDILNSMASPDTQSD